MRSGLNKDRSYHVQQRKKKKQNKKTKTKTKTITNKQTNKKTKKQKKKQYDYLGKPMKPIVSR